MCWRYYNLRQKDELARRFGAQSSFEELLEPNHNIAPSTFQPIIRNDRGNANRELVLMRWGLVPFFVEELSTWNVFSTVSARAETLMTSKTFCRAFESNRCLVPAGGYYERLRTGNSNKGIKNTFAVSMRSGETFAMAGIWETRKDQDGTTLQSFALVTTTANELIAPVHNRMPVILHERDWDRWLERGSLELPPADLLQPFDSEAMQMMPCNSAVSDVFTNRPETLVCPESIESSSLRDSA